jgi:hypothetical protein
MNLRLVLSVNIMVNIETATAFQTRLSYGSHLGIIVENRKALPCSSVISEDSVYIAYDETDKQDSKQERRWWWWWTNF